METSTLLQVLCRIKVYIVSPHVITNFEIAHQRKREHSVYM